MNRTLNIVKIWSPVVLWVCCIFLLSTDAFSSENTSRILERLLRFLSPHISAHDIDIIHYFVRKAAHMIEYCIMSLLLFHSFRNTFNLKGHWHWALYSLIIIVGIAASDELHQWFVESRTSSVIDVGIDITGGMLGLAICLVSYQLRHTKEKKSDIN